MYHQISITTTITITPLYHHTKKDGRFGIVSLASCAADAPRARCQPVRRCNRRWERQPRGYRPCFFSTSSYSSRKEIGYLACQGVTRWSVRFVTHALRTKFHLHRGKTCHQRIKSRTRIRRVPIITRSNATFAQRMCVSFAKSVHRRMEIRGTEKAGKRWAINNTDCPADRYDVVKTRSLSNDNCLLLCQNVEMVYTAVALRTLRLADVTSPPRGGSLANERFAPAPAALQSL